MREINIQQGKLFSLVLMQVNNAKFKGGDTNLHVNAQFQLFGNSPSRVQWSFDVANLQDEFTIQGHIQNLSLVNANMFVKPYLNITLQGQINHLRFNYRADNAHIHGNFSMDHQNLAVNLLKEDNENKRKFISKLVNILIRKKIKSPNEKVIIKVERNRQKSFFNLLWKGVMEGIKKYVI